MKWEWGEMEGKLSLAAKKLESSPIQELSLLAQKCNAINLAEGFPDFPAPSHIKNAAVSAILSDFNQYRSLFSTLVPCGLYWTYPRFVGVLNQHLLPCRPNLLFNYIFGVSVWIFLFLLLRDRTVCNLRHVQGICDHLARTVKEMHGLEINPLSDIAICCGQTEAFAAAVFSSMYSHFCCFISLKSKGISSSYLVVSIQTVIDQGDEVIVFDPSYETYEACIILAGGVPVSFQFIFLLS